MRVFLGPDDRKIAAKPDNNSNHKHNHSQQQPRKKFKRSNSGSDSGSGSSNNNNNSNSNSSNNLKKTNLNKKMGGGGRLHQSHPAGEAALKGEEKTAAAAAAEERQQPRRRRDDVGGTMMNEGPNHGPRGAVAAAAASPHHSTINASRGRMQNPEEDDEWQDNDSKPSSSRHNIFWGKSNDDDYARNHGNNRNRRSRRYKSSSGRSSSSSSSLMQQPREEGASPPLLGGPIPGSMDDPATMSKTDQDEIDGDNTLVSRFMHLLRTQHKPPLDMVEMEGDGNCLFRAISLQVYGDPSMHLEARRRCLDFMEREADHFHNFVADEDFDEYIARKRTEGVHGNHTEIQAMSELYNRSIEVYVPDLDNVKPINIFHSEYKRNDDTPIRLCYMDGNHYDAVIDPLVPTAGLGLGLPGLQPGLADKLQLEEAKKISDESVMEEKMRLAVEESNRASKAREEIEMKEALRKSSQLMASTATTGTALGNSSDDDMYKKKAMYLSEIEAADFDLEQAVLASSLESYRQSEQERKPPSSRRGDGRMRSRFNSSPLRSQRSSSNSPVYRTNAATASASSQSSNQYVAAAAASAATSSSAASSAFATSANRNNFASITTTTDEYPASVQELVMNGFELSKVLHAYDLIGDNFDDLLSFLLSSTA